MSQANQNTHREGLRHRSRGSDLVSSYQRLTSCAVYSADRVLYQMDCFSSPDFDQMSRGLAIEIRGYELLLKKRTPASKIRKCLK